MGEPVRCSQCSRWLGVQYDGYVESRHRGRAVKVVTGEIACEQCGAPVQIQDGRPVGMSKDREAIPALAALA